MIKEQALKYLGYTNSKIPATINDLIDSCIVEIQEIATPKHMHHTYALSHHPLTIQDIQLTLPYSDLEQLLDTCQQCIIIGCTLGITVDRRIHYYSKFDITRMTILDAVASSYIEYICDDFEKDFPKPHTFRFCPGYGNVPLALNKTFANILDTSKHIGLTVQDSYLLLPQKSMIGIIGIGTSTKKSCHTCVLKEDCKFRKEGTTCY